MPEDEFIQLEHVVYISSYRLRLVFLAVIPCAPISKMPDVPVSPAAPGASSSSTKTFTINDLKANGTKEKFYMLLHDKGESLVLDFALGFGRGAPIDAGRS